MKIASWSCIHGQTGTTANTIAIAVAVAMGHDMKCILTQTHFSMNNLEAYLDGKKEVSSDVTMDIGLDGLISMIKLRPLNKETVENFATPIISKRLTLLPGTTGANRKVFNDDMGKTAAVLINEINKYFDMVFIDTNSGPDEVSRLIMDQADVIIVNLCQNRSVIEYYNSLSFLKDKKVLYLIGNYDKNSVYSLHNLRLNYKFLTRDNSAIIPYDTDFMDSMSDGTVVKFLRKNYNSKGYNSYLMECINDAAVKLVKLVGDKKGVVN